jgi:hypothetical protein
MTRHLPGVAAGVPFVATPPPDGPRADAPVVVAWHLMDPPRTEAAFAAALPLDGLDAWRIYLGLPLSGSRLPPGGPDELMKLAMEDAVLNLQGPVTAQAVEEFPGAFADLRAQLHFGDGPVGLVGGSVGAAVALSVLAESDIVATAAVLVSPLVQLRPAVDAISRTYDMTYSWSAESLIVASRLDFVARADEVAGQEQPAVLLVVGADDDADGFHAPATRLREALAVRYADPTRVDLVSVAGMGHALADEPGVDPAPQTAQAAEVDRHAVAWLQSHLGSGTLPRATPSAVVTRPT